MDDLNSGRLDSGDGHDSAGDARAENDRRLRPVDDKGQETWAENAEALTRGEYADRMRQGPAVEETGPTADADRDRDDMHVPATAEDDQVRKELPEPRTRQEVAADAERGVQADADRNHVADHGRTAADDTLPEPRTRQEVREEARSDRDPLTPSKEEAQAQADSHITVVKVSAAERTLDDTTPTGIGLKPTGEQLLKIENEELSKPERLRRKLLEGIDDINDAARDNASLGHDLLTRHLQPSGRAMTEVPHPLPDASYEGGAAPDITSAGLVAGILLVEATRLSRGPIHRIAEAAKGHTPWR